MLFKKKIGLVCGVLGLYLCLLGALTLFTFHKINEPSFGFAVATDYQAGLAAPMTSSQSFFTVTSLTLRDGTLLSTNELGNKIFFTIEPGKTNEEIVMCTTITAATKQISGCTRGLAFSGTSTAAVAANQKTHSPGSVIVLSNVHYVYNQYLDKNTTSSQSVEGPVVFTAFPSVTSTTAIPATNAELTSWYAAQTLVAGGFSGLNVSSTLGLQAFSGTSNCSTSGTCVGINASTTASANGGFMNFAATTGKLYWDIVSFLAGSWTWVGTNIFNAATITSLTGTSTADNLQITGTANTGNDAVNKSYSDSVTTSTFFGDGSDGAFSSSSGMTTLNTSGKNVYQYTSFSLTGTASINTGSNLTNKPLYIFVQGDLTITSASTSAIFVSGQGGPGGTAGSSGDNAGAGTSGGTSFADNGGAKGSQGDSGSGGGGGGGYGNSATNGGASGAAGGVGGVKTQYATLRSIGREVQTCFLGGGGGGGGQDGSTGNDGGAGGNGGGCVIFLVGGSVNITSTFSAAGTNGSNGVNGTNSGGGGGGGGGGFIGIYYIGSLTANTATLTVSGGTGGTSGDGGAGGNGAAGQSEVRQIKVKGFVL